VNWDAEVDLACDGYRVVCGGDKRWIAERRQNSSWQSYRMDRQAGTVGQRDLLFTHKKQALAFIVRQRRKDTAQRKRGHNT
jgi:hypothetical protein